MDMDKTPTEVFNEMFANLQEEIDRVSGMNSSDWARSIASEIALGMFHRTCGAIYFAYQVGEINIVDFLTYSEKTSKMIRSMYKE